jgi:hypothetical protein
VQTQTSFAVLNPVSEASTNTVDSMIWIRINDAHAMICSHRILEWHLAKENVTALAFWKQSAECHMLTRARVTVARARVTVTRARVTVARARGTAWKRNKDLTWVSANSAKEQQPRRVPCKRYRTVPGG